MNNNFDYNYNPFTGEPKYDFYDEMVVKDARRATNRSMLSLILYMVAGMVLMYTIDFVVALVMIYGLGRQDLYLALSESSLYTMLLGSVPMYAAGIPVVALILKSVPKKQKPVEKPKMSFGHFLMMIPIAELAMLMGSYIGSYVSAIYSALLGVENNDVVSDLIASTPMPLLILLTVILAPLFEELIFRKLLLDRLSVYGSKFAIIITAVAFGLFHGNLDQFFYAALVGLVLGYVAVKSGNWLYSVLIHMVMNFIGGVLPALFYDSIMTYEEFAYAIMENPEAFTTIPTDIATDVMIGMLYNSLISTLAIAGIVFLVLGITKKWFKVDERLSIRIPKKRTAGVIFRAPATIIFLVMSGLLMILDLYLPVIQQMLEQAANGGMGV